MSVSVDDLISSFSSNHISQEALDIAALQVHSPLIITFPFVHLETSLQAQLLQTLVTSSTSNGPDISRASSQPCNTPTGCTSSATFSWDFNPSNYPLQRHPDEIWHKGPEIGEAGNEMDEDERVVNNLLLPSPTFPDTAAQPFSLPHHQPLSHQPPSTTYFCASTAETSSASLFASTDPFYIAQLQATENYTSSPPSLLSQAGLPAQHSPFLIHHPHYQLPHCEGHGYLSRADISVGNPSHS
jgi:hypothetical protein